MSGFIHLHTHTEYSLLDGSNKISDYVSRVKELGMDACAITDHGNMYGVIQFYKTCKEKGILPIIGCEVYVAPGSRYQKDGKQDKYHHLVLLAENNTGFHNLQLLVSKGFTEGYYYKPRIDKDLLQEHHDGIIALSACLAGEIPQLLLAGKYDKAKQCAIEYQDIFGHDNYFLELQDHRLQEQQTVNSQLIRLSKDLNIPLVATNDCHYTLEKDAEAHDVLLCIQTGKKLTDTDRMKYDGGQFYVKSESEMQNLFSYVPDAIENTGKIASRCHVEITFGNYKIPTYILPDGYDQPYSFLHTLCEKGIRQRYPDLAGEDDDRYKRMSYELQTIDQMGFVEYILIVWDYINWAKTHGIAVGPGRGSAAGSVVCYSIGITDIDPFKYGLLFERFLNPERVSMPDIDVDFDDVERERVIEYVAQRYGVDHVSQITSFGTMAARGVIKAVGKVMDFPYSQMNALAKMVPAELHMTIKKALEINPDLKNIYETDSAVRNLIDTAQKLEGLPNHTTVHAAGVVIYPQAAENCVPLGRSSDGGMTAQYDMVQLEELGYLKMDLLGLRTLTVIKDAVKNVRETKRIDIEISAIDLNDPETLAFIGTGKTEGVFQLESQGMQDFMKELRPKSFEDVIAGISLYRPGPMDFIPSYIKGKNNPESITYLCPQLEPILKPTYGCIVYQEQVMQIVQTLAGYSMGQADNIRRAMSKKKQHVIDAERKNFVYGDPDSGICGCVANGISEDIANTIYDSMVDFAKYAFNKSHAAAYAVLSMQTAWLKHYYPTEYMAALMTSVIENPDKLTPYIIAAKSMGIQLLPPDINCSLERFSVCSENQIRYALCGIKGISVSVAKLITDDRLKNGLYHNSSDAMSRLTGIGANKKCIRNLILSGAFDSFGDGTRKQLEAVHASYIDSLRNDQKNNISGQISLFDLTEVMTIPRLALPGIGEFDEDTKLRYEKEVSGIYISSHPLEHYAELISAQTTCTTTHFKRDENGTIPLMGQTKERIGGMISSVKTVLSKKSNKFMAFATLEDLYGKIEVIVFPQCYEKYKESLKPDKKVILSGTVSVEDDGDAKFICDKVDLITDIPKKVWIQFNNMDEYQSKKKALDAYSNSHPGRDSLIIYILDPRVKKEVKHCVLAEDDTPASLSQCLGGNKIAVTL